MRVVGDASLDEMRVSVSFTIVGQLWRREPGTGSVAHSVATMEQVLGDIESDDGTWRMGGKELKGAERVNGRDGSTSN